MKRLLVLLLLAPLACAGTPLLEVPSSTCPPLPTVLPGTPTPVPLPTPPAIQPPDDFYLGDTVEVGSAGQAQHVRFRLLDVQSIPQPDAAIHTWELEVTNLGTAAYEVYPAVQMVLSAVETPSAIVTGTWGASAAAGEAVGLTVDGAVYTLLSGETRRFRLAAQAPAGAAYRFRFALDPTVSDSPAMTWRTVPNPVCG